MATNSHFERYVLKRKDGNMNRKMQTDTKSNNKTNNQKGKCRLMLALLLCGILLMPGCGTGEAARDDASPQQEAEAEDIQKTEQETEAEDIQKTEQEAETEDNQKTEQEAETDDLQKTEQETASNEAVEVSVGSLKGPTSMGLVKLMEKSAAGECQDTYSFTMETGADVIASALVKGDLDIALLPANMAGILYRKTGGQITVADINTLSVLYMVSANTQLSTVEDLKGQTVYLTGKGTTPDYVLQYLLTQNGIQMDDVSLEYLSEPTEVVSKLVQDEQAVGLLPQPFVTAACAQNDQLKIILDCGQLWEAVTQDGSSVVTGVTVVRNDFLEEHRQAVMNFLAEHRESAEFAVSHVEDAAGLVVKYGILEKEPIAQKSIPYCNITYIDGTEMKQALSGYLKVLYDMDPESVGGALPDEDFYLE